MVWLTCVFACHADKPCALDFYSFNIAQQAIIMLDNTSSGVLTSNLAVVREVLSRSV